MVGINDVAATSRTISSSPSVLLVVKALKRKTALILAKATASRINFTLKIHLGPPTLGPPTSVITFSSVRAN